MWHLFRRLGRCSYPNSAKPPHPVHEKVADAGVPVAPPRMMVGVAPTAVLILLCWGSGRDQDVQAEEVEELPTDYFDLSDPLFLLAELSVRVAPKREIPNPVASSITGSLTSPSDFRASATTPPQATQEIIFRQMKTFDRI